MPNDTDHLGSSSLLNSITRMLDTGMHTGAGLDNIITVLSLLCLFSIMNRNHAGKDTPQTQPATATNPLHKLLGDLTKGSDGGFTPDTLMSLLPLLNNPQLKSKLNPGTMSTVLGLLNNLGSLGGGSPSPDKDKDKAKAELKPSPPTETPPQQETEALAPSTNVAQQVPVAKPPQTNEEAEEAETKNHSRYLNWKNNF
ncbi:hypothetical protein [Sporomusa acidovorans]|uniref:DUF937 domain-containing protein n=1 Tax=Sporomusa acidovorans (strain ATCC 49682 / DSM 3132 / Mol) TaxID=1123286 RepID=A0ABZ3J424_SPOA4|nr:hypothetical protein [Sporomusa acidovorans]OZC20910.1 hypothetical protein SPACI_22730 [Sporomusa acidovorans DSM 3132]SDE60847.1 hypothetical protein SAMN04488499_101758 [Sporomusa acidovorans]